MSRSRSRREVQPETSASQELVEQKVMVDPAIKEAQQEQAEAAEETGELVSLIPDEVATPEAEAASEAFYGKYRVERSDGKDDQDARYFVLDYANDPSARAALKAYIGDLTSRGKDRELAKDLHRQLGMLNQTKPLDG